MCSATKTRAGASPGTARPNKTEANQPEESTPFAACAENQGSAATPATYRAEKVADICSGTAAPEDSPADTPRRSPTTWLSPYKQRRRGRLRTAIAREHPTP